MHATSRHIGMCSYSPAFSDMWALLEKNNSITEYGISRHIGICADIRQLFQTCGQSWKRTTILQNIRFQGILANAHYMAQAFACQQWCGERDLQAPWPGDVTRPCSLYGTGLRISAMVWGKGPAGTMVCLLYTSPSPRDYAASRMPSSS